jgi:hypothetical protein
MDLLCNKPEYLWSPARRTSFLNDMWEALHIKDSNGQRKFSPSYLSMLVRWEFSIGHLYNEEVNQFMAYLTENEKAGLKKILIHNGYTIAFGDDSKYKRIIMAITLCSDAGSPELQQRADTIKKIVQEAPDDVTSQTLYPRAVELLQDLGEEFGLQLAVKENGQLFYEIPSEEE